MRPAHLIVMMALLAAQASAGSLDENFSAPGSSCGQRWFNDCVAGWAGIGGTGSLATTHVTGAPSRVGVLVKGGSQQAPNGVSRTYTIPSGATASALQRLNVIAMGQGGDLRARLTYRDAQGGALATVSGFWTMVAGTSMSLSQRDVIPVGAATVEVEILVRGADVRVFVEDWAWDGTVSGASGDPATQEDCDAQAADIDAEEKAKCETERGTWLGSACTGFPHPNEAGCAFVCADMCSKAGNSVVVPSGF